MGGICSIGKAVLYRYMLLEGFARASNICELCEG